VARIRSIKPQFFMNEDVASLPYEWRLLFIGLWTQADRDGRIEDRPQRLKAALFPYDDLNIDQGLGRLANAGLINRYERDGQRLICIPKWAKHQQPHIREAVSELPPPDASTVQALFEPVGLRKGADPDPDQGRSTSTGEVLARFEEFWAVYPRHVAKDAARKVWLKLAPDVALTALLVAKVREHARSPQWVKDGGAFIPHPRTWLSQKRWEDETQQQKPRQPEFTPWECAHLQLCPNQTVCRHKDAMPHKYPKKALVQV
jgi:hypothetical protein